MFKYNVYFDNNDNRDSSDGDDCGGDADNGNDPDEGRREGNVLFNDAFNTFYLRLYGIRDMVKDHSEREETASTWATLSG